MIITRYDKHNEPIIFKVKDKLIEVSFKRDSITAYPDGNSFYYSLLEPNNLFSIKKDSIIHVCNKKQIKFKINKITECQENSNDIMICFLLHGSLIKK